MATGKAVITIKVELEFRELANLVNEYEAEINRLLVVIKELNDTLTELEDDSSCPSLFQGADFRHETLQCGRSAGHAGEHRHQLGRNVSWADNPDDDGCEAKIQPSEHGVNAGTLVCSLPFGHTGCHQVFHGETVKWGDWE